MVAADDKHFFVKGNQPGNKAVKQGHGLCLRRGTLVHVPGDEHGIHLLLIRDGGNLGKDDLLILQERKVVHLFAEVKVGNMQEFHKILLICKGCGRGKCQHIL